MIIYSFSSDLSETGCKLQLDMSELMLQQRDFDAAFVGFSPLSLRGIELHNSETQGWSDVGGLEEVKSLLMETFVWPAKVRQFCQFIKLLFLPNIKSYCIKCKVKCNCF